MIGEGFILQTIHGRAFQSGDRLIEFGTVAFVTTGSTVEITTNLSVVECVLALPKTVTYGVNDQLSSDGVVTTGAVTLARNASGTNGLSAYYLMIGYRYD